MLNKKLNVWMLAVLSWHFAVSQDHPLYQNLPQGKYAVGFKIMTITDESRVTLPEYNYLGERNEGDRSKKITIHIWYPAKAKPGKHQITYGQYTYHHLISSTNEILDKDRITAEHNSRLGAIERWFGKPDEAAWKQLLNTAMLAQAESEPVQEKFPLLIGVLRPLSTSITNELLASNGYVVAMIKQDNFNITSFPEMAFTDLPSLQMALAQMMTSENVDKNLIGAFGFSGSGFVQVLLAMQDSRIKALADIESGLYMDQLYQPFARSNYYNPRKLRIPFLHIFSRDLSKEEKFIGDFTQKTKFSERYQLLLNQPKLHHWDFAAEGYVSCLALKNRGAAQDNIRKSFEVASMYLLNFFNAKLKGERQAAAFIADKPRLKDISSDLWDINFLPALKPAPTRDEFEMIIRKRGVGPAIEIVKNTIVNDSSSNVLESNQLNFLGSVFLREKKYKEAIEIFKLNTEWHPEDPNLWDSLAEGYEAMEDFGNMKSISAKVISLLEQKENLTEAEKSLRQSAERRMKM